MRNKLLMSCFIVLLGIYSCGKGGKSETAGGPNDQEKDRANVLGVQGTELEETSNSSETTDGDRTNVKNDTVKKQ